MASGNALGAVLQSATAAGAHALCAISRFMPSSFSAVPVSRRRRRISRLSSSTCTRGRPTGSERGTGAQPRGWGSHTGGSVTRKPELASAARGEGDTAWGAVRTPRLSSWRRPTGKTRPAQRGGSPHTYLGVVQEAGVAEHQLPDLLRQRVLCPRRLVWVDMRLCGQLSCRRTRPGLSATHTRLRLGGQGVDARIQVHHGGPGAHGHEGRPQC